MNHCQRCCSLVLSSTIGSLNCPEEFLFDFDERKVLWIDCGSEGFLVRSINTFQPLYVQLPNFRSHFWSSNGNHVISILHVLLKMPGGTYRQFPVCETTTFVWNVPSNFSSALQHNEGMKKGERKKKGMMEKLNLWPAGISLGTYSGWFVLYKMYVCIHTCCTSIDLGSTILMDGFSHFQHLHSLKSSTRHWSRSSSVCHIIDICLQLLDNQRCFLVFKLAISLFNVNIESTSFNQLQKQILHFSQISTKDDG